MRLPRKPRAPALQLVSTLPSRSVMVITVLLKVALMQAIPCSTVIFSFFFFDLFLLDFLVLGIFCVFSTSSFYEFPPYADPFWYERWYGSSGLAREGPADDAIPGNS